MSWQPEVIQPTPDPFYVRELRHIDPDLRIVWGFQRYLLKQWVIERKIEPARYFAMYASLLESDAPRFIDQPIFDTSQPEFNDWGEQTGYKLVGHRKFDLAPEYEYVLSTDTLDGRLVTELRRVYAEERGLSTEEQAVIKAEEQAARDAAIKKTNADIGWEGVKEGWRKMGKTAQVGPPSKIFKEDS